MQAAARAGCAALAGTLSSAIHSVIYRSAGRKNTPAETLEKHGKHSILGIHTLLAGKRLTLRERQPLCSLSVLRLRVSNLRAVALNLPHQTESLE